MGTDRPMHSLCSDNGTRLCRRNRFRRQRTILRDDRGPSPRKRRPHHYSQSTASIVSEKSAAVPLRRCLEAILEGIIVVVVVVVAVSCVCRQVKSELHSLGLARQRTNLTRPPHLPPSPPEFPPKPSKPHPLSWLGISRGF